MEQNFDNQFIFPRFSSGLWSLKKDVSKETFEVEETTRYVFVDIRGAEIAELREQIKRLEEKLEQREDRQIIPINFFETEKLRLKKSFYAVLEYHPKDNLYIVDCPELNVYGEGQDRAEALDDFKIALEETYLSLKEDKDILTSQPAKEWKILNDIIEEK